ncbi:MAG: DUF2505 domain-containing protein [Actinomycetota bacterium]|nr:DUF2505 domain-containing protein [Actinomycetota bacterium]
MSRDIRGSFDLPGTVEEAFAAISTEGWAAAKAEQLGDGSTLVRRDERPDGGVTMVVSRALPSGVPGFLARFLPKDGRVTQTDDWEPAAGDGVRRGTWTLEIPGSPGDVRGTVRLEPTATGSRQVNEGTAKVSIPLVGGKAESFIAEMAEKVMAKEADVLRGMLS